MKEQYIKPEIDVVMFENKDVITTSEGGILSSGITELPDD